ncbi:MAG: hypothetical protein NXI04_22635 [Planctomycetaceae bacterium]|nr:hypothetical protein [Planctomycetaceae bacterium]
MLTRRNAILSGAAMAAGAASAGASTASVGASAGTSAEVDSRDLAPSATLLQDVARECLLLAGAAQQCLKSCLGCTDAGTKAFALLCQDVQQICAVTATRICQDGSGSPAICQASADAATRLATACESINLRGLEKFCQTQAQRCARMCRSSVMQQTV